MNPPPRTERKARIGLALQQHPTAGVLSGPAGRLLLHAGCLASVLSFASSRAAVSQEIEAPDTSVGPILEGEEARSFLPFLEAFNAGQYDPLQEYFGRRVAGRPAGEAQPGASAASYWLSVYHELGPVELLLVDREESPPLYWVRGSWTGGWAGFQFASDSAGRITGYGVRRGVRPAGAPPAPTVEARRLPEFLHRHFEALAGDDLFSGAALVARDGVPIFEGAWGWADRGLQVPNHLDTRFDVASVTKTFTAVAIAQLAARGTLSLDDPLERWIPELPDHVSTAVTIRHLLTHTSGIELDDHAPYNATVAGAGSVEELVAAQVEFMPHLNSGNYDEFRPPGSFDYSNENFDLLGAIVEQASGLAWEEYLRTEIFAPAGMFSTGVDYRRPVRHMATRYRGRFPGFRGYRRLVPADEAPQARPAGGAYSTVGDLLRFAEALRRGVLLEPDEWKRITELHVVALEEPGNLLGYGYGFEVERKGGLLRVGHAGGSVGVSARFDLYPELGYVVILLSNYDRSTRHSADHIGEVLAGLDGRTPN